MSHQEWIKKQCQLLHGMKMERNAFVLHIPLVEPFGPKDWFFNFPELTIVLIKEPGGWFKLGYSVQSPKDEPNRKAGNAHAFARAVGNKAFSGNSEEVIDKVISLCSEEFPPHKLRVDDYDHEFVKQQIERAQKFVSVTSPR